MNTETPVATAPTAAKALPLTRCRNCSSKLLQLVRVRVLLDGRHVARRRCPECECVDDVVAGPLALSVWRRVAQRRSAALERSVRDLTESSTEPQQMRK